MRIEPRASGIQIALLVFLVEFLVAIAAKPIAAWIRWPADFFNLLGNIICFAIALAVIFGVASLRRHFMRELATTVPPGLRSEVLLVALLKPAIPFGIMGLLAWSWIAWAPGADLFARLGLASDPELFDRRYFSAYGLVQATLINLIVGPFVEELVFRGLLYRAWERDWGWIPAMLATSVAFALAHPSNTPTAFVGSMVFVCLLRRTGSLWAPICAHAIYNLAVSWPLLGHVLLVRSRDEVIHPEAWTVEIACFAGTVMALAWYVWLARKPHVEVPETVLLAPSAR